MTLLLSQGEKLTLIGSGGREGYVCVCVRETHHVGAKLTLYAAV